MMTLQETSRNDAKKAAVQEAMESSHVRPETVEVLGDCDGVPKVDEFES